MALGAAFATVPKVDLSDGERLILERQVRGRRVARSISGRCRMILRCADGLTNKTVAGALGAAVARGRLGEVIAAPWLDGRQVPYV